MNPHALVAPSSSSKLKTITRIAALLVLLALLATPFFTVSSASLPITSNDAPAPSVQRSAGFPVRELGLSFRNQFLGLSPLAQPLLPQAGTETIAIYSSDCTTPATDFSLAGTVCVKISNAPTAIRPLRRIAIVNPGNFIQAQADVTSATQTMTFVLPTDATVSYGDVNVDNRGTWRALSLVTSDYSTITGTPFLVRDPQNAAADLSIQSSDSTEAGGVVSFGLYITNNGPDDAVNVQVTDTVPTGTTFFSASQNGGPAFNCQTPAVGAGGTTTCVIPSLPKGAEVKFSFIYSVIASAGAELLHSSQISSDTTEGHAPDNATEATAIVTAAGSGGGTCVLDCPNNITVTANTEQNGISGAVVTFGNADPFGDCGTITASPASGSFFPVGVNTVVVSSGTGSGSCSFQINVVEDAAPSISCPSNVSASTTGCDPATVNVGTPTAGPTGVSVSGQRSDGGALTDPYPVGVTTITWTASDSGGRAATCTQTVTVTSDDTEAPSITAPADVTTTTALDAVGSCGVVIGESELGQPIATDNCTVNVSRSGVPSGNFFPVGTTVITYTATDGAGNTATATQNVTVVDGPPVIFAPPDASYVCLSEVPAADPSQAFGPDVIVNGSPQPGPPADSCSAVTVTVSESSTGAGSLASPKIITRTFTATDTGGHAASAVQTITVTDPTPPTITAPADATYACPSEVPAANPSQATASDNCAAPTVTVIESNNGGSGSVASPRVITRTFTATDAAGNTATATQLITVADGIAPTVTAPAATTASANSSCQAPIPDVTAGSSASDNCGSVTVSQSPAAGTPVGLGTHQITVTATDAAGNSSTATTSVTVSDTTAPVLSCPANIVVTLPPNTSATSMAVNFATPTATDNCSTPTVTTSVASGSVFPVGTTAVTATATDAATNSSSCSFTVTVLYDFSGFFSPVSNLPTLNTVNAGRGIPVKFSLSGDKGLNIFAANSPYSVSFNCDTNDPGVDVVETVNAGTSTLSYGSGQYTYVWKTESSWVGTCRQLVVKLNDGSEHRANFKFR